MSSGTVGVVIRTLNESALIGRCLQTLARQEPGFDLDVLVVDSGSTDDTVAIAESHGARVVHIPPEEFDYSKAINLGFEQVDGDLVLILSAHAIPVDDRWVARMIAPFADPRVAGVASRQVPWDDAPWREVQRLARTFGAERRTFAAADDAAPLFSNAASCVRRGAWQAERFTLPAAEDMEWAARVVAAGWTIVYEPHAAVYHSHEESPRDQARRLIDIHRVIGGERRTVLRTLREASRFLYNDGKAIARLDDPPSRKCAHLADLLQTFAYYIRDFSRVGTTAERRRHDATA